MIKGAMGSADGGPKEPGGTQLAEVQHGLDSFQEDGGEHQPDESELGLPNRRQLPERLIIRMPSDFGNEYVSFEFIKIENNLEIMYESNRGSNWALTDERMLLTLTQGEWIVYDSARLADNVTISCRQAVFHCDKKTLQSEDGICGVGMSMPIKQKQWILPSRMVLPTFLG